MVLGFHSRLKTLPAGAWQDGFRVDCSAMQLPRDVTCIVLHLSHHSNHYLFFLCATGAERVVQKEINKWKWQKLTETKVFPTHTLTWHLPLYSCWTHMERRLLLLPEDCSSTRFISRLITVLSLGTERTGKKKYCIPTEMQNSTWKTNTPTIQGFAYHGTVLHVPPVSGSTLETDVMECVKQVCSSVWQQQWLLMIYLHPKKEQWSFDVNSLVSMSKQSHGCWRKSQMALWSPVKSKHTHTQKELQVNALFIPVLTVFQFLESAVPLRAVAGPHWDLL